MQFTTGRQAEILAGLDAVAALITDTTTHEDLLAQIATLTGERDFALSRVASVVIERDNALSQLATATSERDAAIAARDALQVRLDSIVQDVQALTAADAHEDAARAEILRKAQGG